MSISATDVQKAYLAYFGRPADPTGLAFWETQSAESMYACFAASNEYTTMYSAMSNTQIVAQIYQNILGRTADSAGLLYWTNQLDTGALTIDNVVVYMLNAVSGDDVTTVANRLTYAADFTAAIDTTAEIIGYSGSTAAAAARAALYPVTDDASLATAEANLATSVATVVAAGTTSTSYTLTIGTDTASANLFNAPNVTSSVAGAALDTLQSTDTLTGTGDNATLNADIATATTTRPTLSNIPNVNLTATAAVAAVVDFANTTGMTALSLNSNTTLGATGTMTATNVANIVNITSKNMQGATHQLVAFGDTVLSGSADTLNVTLSGNGVSQANAAGRLNYGGVTTGGAETLDVTVVGNNYITGLSSQGGLAIGAVATATGNSVNTYKFTGADATISIADQLFHATTIDGSGLTGTGRMLVSADITKNVTVTGGAGNDTVIFGTGLTNADSYDGGTGRDTIRVTSTTGVGLGTGNQISNVEILRVDGASTFTFDNDKVTSIDAIVDNSTAAMTYTNMSGAAAADSSKGLTILDGAAVWTEYDIKGATAATATTDALYVNIGSATGNGGVNGGGTAGSLNSLGLETLNLNVVSNDGSTGGATATTMGDINDGATADTLTTVNITGGTAGSTFTINAGAAVTAGGLKTINASEFVSNVVVTLGNVAGSSLTGGYGDDTLTGGTNADTIIGGSGDDSITGGANADTLTGGSGIDTFDYTTATDSSVITATGVMNIDSLTDFVSGTDKIKTTVVETAVSNGNTAASTGGTATTLLADISTALGGVSLTTTAYIVTITGSAGNAGTYLYESAAANTFATGDIVIKLDGTSSTTLALGDFS